MLSLVLLIGCSKSKSLPPNDHGVISAAENVEFFRDIGNVKPYYSKADYAESMSTCVYKLKDEDSCKISELPLIGMNHETVDVDAIMDRTLVSHDFLGLRFEQVLRKLDPEILQLFGSVSAVVISDKVKPSFFYGGTGAIYLSGSYFWTNYEEWELMNRKKDFREGSGLPFQFDYTSDYMKNGLSFRERAEENYQSIDEIKLKLARLLFHELAHANDYFPSKFYKNLDKDFDKTYYATTVERYEKNALVSLKMQTKPRSIILERVGQVLFQSEKANSNDSELTADLIIEEFKNDVTNDFYAYSTHAEDLAMLTEESLMYHYFDYSRFFMIMKYPSSYFVVPENFEYKTAWGEIGRVSRPGIKERSEFVLKEMLGDDHASQIMVKLGQLAPTAIPVGTKLENIYNMSK